MQINQSSQIKLRNLQSYIYVTAVVELIKRRKQRPLPLPVLRDIAALPGPALAARWLGTHELTKLAKRPCRLKQKLLADLTAVAFTNGLMIHGNG